MKNIESSFRQLRLFGMIFLAACTVVTVWSVWSSYSFAEKQREKIYVLDGGKSLMLALSQDLSQNRPAEAREHVRRFHELFFTLAPEKSAIESNVKRALVMADKSAYNYYRDFAEQGFYNRVIAGNINQTVRVDSVVCDFDSYPYQVRTFARQTIIRESNITERTLVTECRLMNSSRSDDNPATKWVEGHQMFGAATPEASSLYMMQRGDYLRLKSAEIGYTFPSKWTSKVKIKALRIYFSGYNLFTITGVYSVDPERPSNLYGYMYPLNRTFNLGLNIKF